MFVTIPNVPNVAHYLPIGSRLSPFWERRKPWGWTLGSTTVEGGIPMSIYLYKNNPGNDLRFHIQGRAYQFKALPFGLSTAGEIDGHTQGFKKPPVPRRLVGESQIPPGLSPTYTGTSK